MNPFLRSAASGAGRRRVAAIQWAPSLLGLLTAIPIGVFAPQLLTALALGLAAATLLLLLLSLRAPPDASAGSADVPDEGADPSLTLAGPAAPQELERLRVELAATQAALRQQSELFSGLSHELRTPLTAILGFADLLRKTRLNHHQEDYLATLDRSARGLLSMLNDVLDWSRIEAGRLSLNVEPFDPADAVEDVVALLAPLAYDKQLELVHIVYHDVPTQLEGDAQRLRQILTNLLSNAIKFTESGEVVLRLMKEREAGDRVWLRVAVSDSGVGLTEAQRARLFQPFGQVASSRRHHHGSGLGLTIVKRLAELMSGNVAVESEPGRGSTFSVVVELAAVPQPDPAPVPGWHQLRQRRVWLCERHPTASLALEHRLHFWGMTVSRFDAITPLMQRLREAAPAGRPDLIVVGLKPVDLDESDVRELGSLCMEAQPPLLALLTSASPGDQQAAIDLGAARALPKSVGRLQLYRELCELARGGPAPTLDRHRLLVADDNPGNLRYLAALGRELGARVIEVHDGAEALSYWRSGGFDSVLADYHMPRLDGPALVRAIREEESREPARRRTRVVATAAHLTPDERQALRRAGCDEVLLKPFDEAQLLRALVPELAQDAPTAALPPSQPARDSGLLALLREELPLQLQALEDAIADRDVAAARANAHTLNGTAAFYQFAQLKIAAREMEEQLAEDEQDDDEIDGSLRRLRASLQATLTEIDTLQSRRARPS